jgi:hypothetical protein
VTPFKNGREPGRHEGTRYVKGVLKIIETA